MTRESSRTDLRLTDELAAMNRRVSPRQIARWREAKIIRYDRQFAGRGNGSSSSYGPEVVAVAAALHDVLKERRSLRDAVLILYAREYNLDLEVVRQALLSYLQSVEHVLRRVVRTARTPAALRDALDSSKDGRAILRRLREAGLDESAFAVILRGLCGEQRTWVSVFLTATGFRDIASSLLDPDTVESLEATLDTFTLPELQSALARSSPGTLRRGLDDSRIVVPFVAHFVEMLARTTNTDDIPILDADEDLDGHLSIAHWSVIAIWAREQGIDLDEGIRQAALLGPGLAGLVNLVRTFSFSRGPLFGANGSALLDQLKPYERESVMGRVTTWLAEHQDESNAIHGLIAKAAAESGPDAARHGESATGASTAERRASNP